MTVRSCSAFRIPLLLLSGVPAGPAHEVSLVSAGQAAEKPSGTIAVGFRTLLTPGVNYIVEDSPDLKTWNRVSPLLRPPAGNLDWSHTQGTPYFTRAGEPVPAIYVDGLNHWYTRRFYRVRNLPPADELTGGAAVVPVGRLQQELQKGPLRYTTSGNWVIMLDTSTCTITSDDGNTTYQFWGSGNVHENLNGKHMKDWAGSRRTILLPGNVMITLSSGEVVPGSGEATIRTVSIYDVDQTHRLNMHTHEVEVSVLLVRVGEAAEADGETMRIWHTGGGVHYAENIYTEAEPGDGTSVLQEATPIGYNGGNANPNQVNDLYDDPRLGHT